VTQQLRIEDAQRRFARQWSWIVVVAVVAMIAAAAIVAYGTMWWEQREVARMQLQREQLQVQLDELRGQLEQARRETTGRKTKP
jgi:hypothetical protein